MRHGKTSILCTAYPTKKSGSYARNSRIKSTIGKESPWKSSGVPLNYPAN
jgi:hypothetical protein